MAAALMPLASAATPSPAEATKSAPAGDAAYGEYLSGDCTSCHRASGADAIPPIIGWHPEDFVRTMQDFRDGTRENEVMNMMARRLDDDDIAALAAYFASLTP